jgi:hypothetical protein
LEAYIVLVSARNGPYYGTFLIFWWLLYLNWLQGIPTLEETDAPEEPAKNVWEWMANTLF